MECKGLRPPRLPAAQPHCSRALKNDNSLAWSPVTVRFTRSRGRSPHANGCCCRQLPGALSARPNSFEPTKPNDTFWPCFSLKALKSGDFQVGVSDEAQLIRTFLARAPLARGRGLAGAGLLPGLEPSGLPPPRCHVESSVSLCISVSRYLLGVSSLSPAPRPSQHP